MTDHAAAPGCRPALNIDVLRVLGVCRSPRELLAAMAALEARFGGCGRVKNGFATADAKAAEGFHLRVMRSGWLRKKDMWQWRGILLLRVLMCATAPGSALH